MVLCERSLCSRYKVTCVILFHLLFCLILLLLCSCVGVRLILISFSRGVYLRWGLWLHVFVIVGGLRCV